MAVDKETIAQVLVSITAVGLFIAGLMALTAAYGTVESDGAIEITPSGGLILVGFIALFIVMMPVFGYFLERADLESDSE